MHLRLDCCSPSFCVTLCLERPLLGRVALAANLGLELVRDAYVFQAGTTDAKGLLTKGGRVLAVTAFGKDLEQAIAAAYRSAALISFEGRIMRSDIGHDLVRMRGTRTTAQQPV